MTDKDKRTDARRFYKSALTRAERRKLPSAMSIGRHRRRDSPSQDTSAPLGQEKPDEFALLLRGIGMLAKTLSFKYKLSSGSTEELEKEMLSTVEGLLQAIAEESPSAV